MAKNQIKKSEKIIAEKLFADVAMLIEQSRKITNYLKCVAYKKKAMIIILISTLQKI